MRSKFYLHPDQELEASYNLLLKDARKLAVCAMTMRSLRDPVMSSDGVKLMTAMKKVQSTIRKYKLVPKDMPGALRARYQSGLSMDN